MRIQEDEIGIPKPVKKDLIKLWAFISRIVLELDGVRKNEKGKHVVNHSHADRVKRRRRIV